MRYSISRTLARSLAMTTLLTGAALAEVPHVVTDIAPVHSLVTQVMGDLGRPDLLLDRGADPHSFQLRPRQAAGLADADLVVWIGPELTPWLDRALTGLAGKARVLTLLAQPETYRQDFGTKGGHDHMQEDDHGAEAGHDEHAHAGTDPHAWLDPGNAGIWLGLIAADLARLDPENAATYAANAKAAQAGITALDAEVANLLTPVKDMPFVVGHDAYGYFSGHFALAVTGSIALGDAAAPGAARLVALQKELKTGQALCVFPEINHDPKLAARIIEGTAARLGGALDPAGTALEPGAELYGELLRGLAHKLTACLAGG
ncbi:MAG: zinc ABC transporter substrate-binding protein [Paracoccaceae bacterium]|nr:zinc ABC transporter substrate-binding protein [Paracoccaceae bacterium]